VNTALLLSVVRGFFGVFEFVLAARVAALLCEGAGAFEFLFVAENAGAVKGHIGQVQSHGTALGDLLGFISARPRELRLALHRLYRFTGREGSSGDFLDAARHFFAKFVLRAEELPPAVLAEGQPAFGVAEGVAAFVAFLNVGDQRCCS
jgi:hypothetical protein